VLLGKWAANVLPVFRAFVTILAQHVIESGSRCTFSAQHPRL
jgi:hypothetical protein